MRESPKPSSFRLSELVFGLQGGPRASMRPQCASAMKRGHVLRKAAHCSGKPPRARQPGKGEQPLLCRLARAVVQRRGGAGRLMCARYLLDGRQAACVQGVERRGRGRFARRPPARVPLSSSSLAVVAGVVSRVPCTSTLHTAAAVSQNVACCYLASFQFLVFFLFATWL